MYKKGFMDFGGLPIDAGALKENKRVKSVELRVNL
jgi:hypothetical protein